MTLKKEDFSHEVYDKIHFCAAFPTKGYARIGSDETNNKDLPDLAALPGYAVRQAGSSNSWTNVQVFCLNFMIPIPALTDGVAIVTPRWGFV